MSAHIRRRRAVLLAFALWTAPYFSAAQNQRNVLEVTTNPEAWGFSSTKLAQLRARMQSYIDDRKLPGLATLLARKEQVIHFEQHLFLSRSRNEILGLKLAQTTEVMQHSFMQEFHTLVNKAFEKEKASH